MPGRLCLPYPELNKSSQPIVACKEVTGESWECIAQVGESLLQKISFDLTEVEIEVLLIFLPSNVFFDSFFTGLLVGMQSDANH